MSVTRHSRLFYLIGVPGAGKTTAMRLVFGQSAAASYGHPFAHRVYPAGKTNQGPTSGNWVCELGKLRAHFSGTDALGMAVQPQVLDWLQYDCPYPNVVGEGDRLGNVSFLQGARGLGWEVTVACLILPPDVAEARRQERAQKMGVSAQSETWLKGRQSKINGLAPLVSADWWIDATAEPEVIAARILEHPCFASIREERERATRQGRGEVARNQPESSQAVAR